MTPSQDLSRIRDVAGHCIPYGITGYQGDSASNVPLDAEASGFCHDIFHSSICVRGLSTRENRSDTEGAVEEDMGLDGWMDGCVGL